MISAIILIVSLFVSTFGGSMTTDLIARAESPKSLSNDLTYYKEGSSGSYSDGMSMSFDSTADYIYFCGVFSVSAGDSVELTFTGASSEYSAQRSQEFSSSASWALSYGYPLVYWSTDSAIIVKAIISDSSGNIVDSKVITINISFENKGEVTDLVVRIIAPKVYEDYTEEGSDVYLNGETVNIGSLSDILYFCSVYSPATIGYSHNIEVVGETSGNSQSSTVKRIGSSTSGTASCQGWSLNHWSNDETLNVYSYYYDTSNNKISEKSIVITIQVSGSGSTGSSGYCEEKPNKTKASCYNQKTQSACENYSKCQWIS